MKIKLLQELNPSERTLKAISSTHPYKIQITSGKINILEPTNIETIIPIRYLLFYRTKIVEFYEYPEELKTRTEEQTSEVLTLKKKPQAVAVCLFSDEK